MSDSIRKTILLPKDVKKEILIIDLPNYSDSKKLSQYLLSGETIYELKNISSDKPKSLIFENENEGIINESADVLICTKFDLIYLLIPALYNSTNFITMENIIDNNDWLSKVPEQVIDKALNPIVETIDENNETFYKVSQEKVFQYLTNRINNVQKCVKNSSFLNQLKMDLFVSLEEEIPSEILDMEILRTSVNIVTSYVSIPLESDILKHNGYDFTGLNEHKSKVEKLIRTQEAIQEASLPKKNGQRAKPKQSTNSNSKPKKVAVGKGALDSFFKKKS